MNSLHWCMHVEKKSELSMFKDTWVVGMAFDKGSVSFSVSF